jgi:Tol biopolymer transport system component
MSATATRFYQTGGNLPQNAPSYVERQADTDLYEGLQRGEFCYVLTARQMGKSSLMVRTAARLREEGIAVAVLDLTAIGQNLTVEQWYDGLLVHLGRQFDREEELEKYWLAHARLSPLQRWLGALQHEVLAKVPGRIVVFIDEIDAVRSLPFSTDEFFAALRQCYNRRSEDPEFARLSFCLLGVATPSDLIQDTRTTPFNIGRRIELADFAPSEAFALAEGLGRGASTNRALLERVLYWTGGHPYLTQRLCQAVADCGLRIADSGLSDKDEHAAAGVVVPNPQSTIRNPQLVDRLCEGLFFTPRAQERDDNLLFVRERLVRSEADTASLLDLYARVRGGKRVPDDDTNQRVSLLRLSGIVRADRGWLRVRNRIYERVFDRAWVSAHMPDAERRRQRSAFLRGLWRATMIAAVIVAAMGGLALTAMDQARRADQQRRRAEDRERASRDYLYAAQMFKAQLAWQEGNAGGALELLEAWRPKAGQEDRRGFEWRYLWRLCHSDRRPRGPGQPAVIPGVHFSTGGETPSTAAERIIRLWDRGAGADPTAAVRAKAAPSEIRFSPDGKTLATGQQDGRVVLWSVAGQQQRAVLKGHTSWVGSLAYSPDGRILATGSDDRTVKLWDTQSRRVLTSLSQFRGGWWGLEFSPDGKTLAIQGHDAVRLWDLTRRRIVATFPWDPESNWGLTFSPDGRRLAAVTRWGTVSLWDLATRRAAATFKGWDPLGFTPDGRTLVTSGSGGTRMLWDLNTHRLLGTLKGHIQQQGDFAFSPDGKTLAIIGTGSTILLWNPGSQQEVATLRDHTARVTDVAFSPDGDILASSSQDGTVRLRYAAPLTQAVSFSVTASAGDRTVRLDWRPVSSAQAYRVYRGVSDEAPMRLAPLASLPAVQTTFTDRRPSLVNGRPQGYAVMPIYQGSDGQRVGGPLVTARTTPVAAPPGLLGTSINEGGKSGSAVFHAEKRQITMRGSGWDIWDSADGFYFLHQPLSGDFQVTVTALTRPSATHDWAQAGLMARESLDATARHSSLFIAARRGLDWKWRVTPDDLTLFREVIPHSALKPPVLLRLTRRGDTITAEYSRDNGRRFQSAGDPVLFDQALPQTMYAGLAISAHDVKKISEAKFRDLQIKKL